MREGQFIHEEQSHTKKNDSHSKNIKFGHPLIQHIIAEDDHINWCREFQKYCIGGGGRFQFFSNVFNIFFASILFGAIANNFTNSAFANSFFPSLL